MNLQLNWEGLDISILGPACVAGLIVLSTHVPLGKQVLARGIIFIDLAIAQIAALGVISAGFFGIDEHGLGVQVAAAIAALLGAGLLAWTDRRWPEYQEPLIGTLFVLAATGALLLLANNPQGGEHLKDLLVGQILWVSYAQLIPAAVVSALLLG
ncbi:MAG: metal ABC transporter permease, partial [Arenimonas sp.]|nr:metal ABC transporter permease [Arenimonas sp.]